MASKKILILGGGYAGIEAALTLHKRKKKGEDIEITLIDKNSYHTLLTELHEVAGNRISDDGVIISLKDIFQYTDVNVVKDEINDFDFDKKILFSNNREYKYDYLIIAIGSEPNFFGLPGLEENSYTLWSYNDAIKIREHIKDCFEQASSEKNQNIRKSLLTFVVGGGGFTGVELVGELSHWFKKLCQEYEISKSEPRIILVEMLPTILSTLQPASIKKVSDYLENKLHVDVRTKSLVVEVTEKKVILKTGEEIFTNTLIWTAGIKPAKIGRELCVKNGKVYRMDVDKCTETRYEHVYAVGDVAAFSNSETVMPALVEIALQTGNTAALNILADIRGQEKKELNPKLHGVMVSIGNFFTVAEIMGRRLPLLFAILSKYFVNIHYLFGIGGFEQVVKYLKHEFLDRKHKKFHIEKHYTKRTLTLWLVPMRLFLGYSWLYAGWMKIKGDWLTTAMLTNLPPDTNTSATIAGFQMVNEHTPNWYVWIAESIIIPNALFFQALIVILEVGLGLAFITGTMTFFAGLISLGMILNFTLSTGFNEASWWYIPASISMLGGAGMAFGVDYYLLPYLMRVWRYFVRNKRINLLIFK